MKKEEKLLFRELCSFRKDTFDNSLLKFATPQVLGHLFFNRMQAVAYGTLDKHGLLGQVNREFRNSLQTAYEYNLQKNKSYFRCVQYITEILEKNGCNYAMLKGAFLCRFYPDSYRTSNDIDLLVLPEDVTAIGKLLNDEGFKQGNIRSGIFEEASRKEIIASKMLRGETVPYIKEVNRPGMKFLEVDLNFSLDYKNGNSELLREVLGRSALRSVGRTKIRTLDACDFFIHLCSHLYKEAATLPWVEMARDMTLYKYCDIYLLLSDMSAKKTDSMFARAAALGLDKICAFTILQTAALFHLDNKSAVETAAEILKADGCFIHRVYSPGEKKLFQYQEKDIFKRFFSGNRKTLLQEVNV